MATGPAVIVIDPALSFRYFSYCCGMLGKPKYTRLLLLAGMLLVVAGLAVWLWKQKEARETGMPVDPAAHDSLAWAGPPKDTFPYLNHSFSKQVLADSSRVLLLEGAKLDPDKKFPVIRQVKADGDMVFDVPAAAAPFEVRTRLLILTATGPCIFRVVAYSHESGEEVQVLKGMVRAQKAYRSDFPEPDTLRDHQLLMINDSIDLMEKEDDDRTEFREWWESIGH